MKSLIIFAALILIVTRHIPMRRELKDKDGFRLVIQRYPSHKAYPDEKGTERSPFAGIGSEGFEVTRHIPMRRELKDWKNHRIAFSGTFVTRHIPMRRELKD